MAMQTQPDATWQYQYVTGGPRPMDVRRPIFGAPCVGAGAVAAVYNEVAIPTATRTRRLKSQDHVSTEMFGTAPYLGRGDGIMLHVDVANRLRDGVPTLRGDRSDRRWAEMPLDRWDFVNQTPAVQSIAEQLGAQSRLVPIYE